MDDWLQRVNDLRGSARDFLRFAPAELRANREALRLCFLRCFPECVAKGSRLTSESEGRAVFARRCFRVRNRSHMFATVRKCSNPAPMALPLGRALKSDFSWMCHVSVCAAITL